MVATEVGQEIPEMIVKKILSSSGWRKWIVSKLSR